MYRLTSYRVKGVDSELVSMYSPGRSRKKKAMMIMSAVALVDSNDDSDASWARKRST